MKYPISDGSWVKYQGNASSEAYNEDLKNHVMNLIELSKQSEEMKKELVSVYESMRQENVYMKQLIESLQQMIEEVEDRMEFIESGSTGTLSAYCHYFEMQNENSMYVPVGEKPALVSVESQQVTPEVRMRSSKLYFWNESEKTRWVSPELKISIERSGVSASIDENDVMMICDGKSETAWMRTVTTNISAGATKEQAFVIIELPGRALSSLLFNYVSIDPVGETKINGIDVWTGSEWEEIVGVEEVLNRLVPCGSRVFHVEPVMCSLIRLRIETSAFRDEGTKRIFKMGIRNVEVDETIYEASGIFFCRFGMSGMYSLENTPVKFWLSNAECLGLEQEDEAVEEHVSFEIYREQYGVLEKIEESEFDNLAEPVLWIKGTIQRGEENEACPAVYKAELRYSREG